MTKVLVIEDMDELREEVMELLSYEGFEVIGVSNGKEGVEVAKTELPDVILCDIAMPELDGYQTLAILREYPPTATIPFIFVTAKVSRADVRQGMDLGADDYLTKPFTAQELINAVTARLKKNNSLIKYLHQEDQLTHLPSALAFHDQLQAAINKYRELTLLFLDIDHFNLINNTLGYEVGDLLFQAVAERLQQSPNYTVSRLRGDEFAVILPDIGTVEEAHQKGQELLHRLREPFSLYGQDIFLTASIGIALYPKHGASVENLIKSADLAMYSAKQKGGNRHSIFSPDLSVRSSEYMALANNLLRAIEKQEFCVYYQPMYDARSLQIVAVEALVRWQHPKLGLVPPMKFITIAEELGIIKDLGETVLKQALQDLAPLQYRVAVNVSARQLEHTIGLVEFLRNLLRELDAKPENLELEITESTFINQQDQVIEVLTRLRDMGIKIAIDDFGTGYSSLHYLQNLPVDSLKIDRCFISNLEHSQHSQVIVETILKLARSFNLCVTAEGVETKAQLEFLQKQGCDRIQGYLFTPPLGLQQFYEFCRTQST
ncbi:MAG: EAL domain-containing protein [Pseudanabaenaceae cyanobacterium]